MRKHDWQLFSRGSIIGCITLTIPIWCWLSTITLIIIIYFVNRCVFFTQVLVRESKEWEARLEKALRLWQQLQLSAEPLEEWVVQAEQVMCLQGEPPEDLADKHRVRHTSPIVSWKHWQFVGDISNHPSCVQHEGWFEMLPTQFPVHIPTLELLEITYRG